MDRAKLNAAYGKARARLEKLKARLRERGPDKKMIEVMGTMAGAYLYDARSDFPLDLVHVFESRGMHDFTNGALAAYCASRMTVIDGRAPHEWRFDIWMAREEAKLS